MILRKDDPDIYKGTVTDSVYSMQSPKMVIVPETGKQDTHDKELYPGQTNRIQSSVVYPVLSNRNNLLGTLVVHCDKKGFFTEDKAKFWSDLMEIFAKRISFEALKMNSFIELAVAARGTDLRDMGPEPYSDFREWGKLLRVSWAERVS